MCATKYLLQWCPFENRLNTTFSSVEYVVNRFGSIFPTGSLDMNKLSEQFLAYQVLVESAKKATKLYNDKHKKK